MESDVAFRSRLFYLIQPTGALASAIGNADGLSLDDYAERFGLRRLTDAEATYYLGTKK